MLKTSIDETATKLNGPTMGTRWSAVIHADHDIDLRQVSAELQAAVDEVDAQMSTWKPDSDLMRFNRAPVGQWVELPEALLDVVALGLAVGKASFGAFDITLGDAVTAWGFGPDKVDENRIGAAAARKRLPAHDVLEVDQHNRRMRKHDECALDLNGIAKGYGVDRMIAVLKQFGISAALVGIDGEMHALGTKPDGSGWTIAVEAPDIARRAPHSVLELEDAAVATSGDYRHFVELGQRRLSHTMNPQSGAPLGNAPASVTIIAPSCAEADAWATALMVLGTEQGAALAKCHHLNALFLMRGHDGQIQPVATGTLFH